MPSIKLEIKMSLGQFKTQFATLSTVACLSLVVFVAGAVFTAPAPAQVTTEQPAASTNKEVNKTHVVTMSHKFTYAPITLVVDQGDTIVWKNTDLYQHTVTSVDQRSFSSGMMNPRKSWRYKAVKPGTYKYFCALHPNMRGTLIVRPRMEASHGGHHEPEGHSGVGSTGQD